MKKEKLANSKPRGGLTFKSKFNIIVKIVISSCLAFVILDCFSFFYYNVPVSDKSSEKLSNKVTMLQYPKNYKYFKAKEGFSYGKTNNEGYINTFDYIDNMPINILIIGSSQMEALHVNMDESTSFLLNQKLNDKIVYNLGISGQKFLICANNAKYAVDKYKPSDFVIFETDELSFNIEELNKTLKGENDGTNSETSTIMSIIKNNVFFRNFYTKNPFLKLVYIQFQNYINNNSNDIEAVEDNTDEKIDKLINDLLNNLNNDVSKYGAKAIILYKPKTTLNNDGSLILSSEQENVEKFKEVCQKNGIYFLDMSDRFREEYENNYILPYGFSNTSVGTGHLNKYGHVMITDELYKLIKGGE